MVSILKLMSVILLAAAMNAVAFAEIVDLEDQILPLELNDSLSYLEDNSDVLLPRDFLTPAAGLPQIQETFSTANIGLTNSAYWFSVKLRNRSAVKRDLILQFDQSRLDVIQIYYINGQEIEAYPVMGAKKSYDTRPIKHRYYLSSFAIEGNDSIRVLLKIKTSGAMKFGLTLHDERFFWQQEINDVMLTALYYGAVLIVFLYCGMLLQKSRSEKYAFLLAYVLGFSVAILAKKGLGIQYLWSDLVMLQDHFLMVGLALAGWGLAGLGRSLLDTQHYAPRLDLILKYSSYILLGIVAISALLHPTSLFIPLIMFLAVVVGTLIIMSYFGVQHRRIEAKYFMAALVIGGTFFIVGLMGSYFWSDRTILIDFSYQMSSLGSLLTILTALFEQNKSHEEIKIGLQKDAADQLQVTINDRMTELLDAKEESEKTRLQAEDQARDLQEQDKQKTSFFENISHELRTPLTFILNPLQSAQEKFGNDKDIQTAIKNSQRLLRLVNQLLDFQKVKAGRRQLKSVPLNLNRFLTVCGEYFQTACFSKGVEFALTRNGNPLKDGEDGLLVLGEVDALEKIIFNYLSNALKYTPAGGRINLGLETDGHLVRIVVADTGLGIPKDKQTRLFEVFGQVGVNPGEDEGTGLGLALVKSLTEEMNGTVGVESDVGEGSTFWAEFELLEAAKPLTRILLVEDDVYLRRAILDFVFTELELEEEEVGAVGSVEEALEYMESYRVSCLISDYNLPGKNGLDLMDYVLHNCPETYRILITAETDFGLLERAINENLIHTFFHKSKEFSLWSDKLVEVLKKNSHADGQQGDHGRNIIDILIVDDCEAESKILSDSLSKSDLDVRILAVTSISEAMKNLYENLVKSVIVNEAIHEGLGHIAVREIAENFPETQRFLMIDQSEDKKSIMEGEAELVTAIFSKPIEIKSVVEQLKKSFKDNLIQDNLVIDEEFHVRSWLLSADRDFDADSSDDCDENDDVFGEGEGAKILIVDDLKDMRDLIASILIKLNYRVLKAANGEIGLAAARSHKPDLIITDWLMPEMDGADFITELKNDNNLHSVPVVLLTAKTGEEIKIKGNEMGADAFLGKPFNGLELASIVRNLLKHQEISERELRHTKNLLVQSEKLSQLGAMVASIGHEIANPVTLVTGGCFNEKMMIDSIDDAVQSLLKGEQKPKEVAKVLFSKIEKLRKVNEAISTGANRLQDLSVALRTQSRMEQKVTLGVEINELIKESMLIVGGKLKSHSVKDLLSDLPSINCYRSKIGQVIINLLANAADAIMEKSVRTAREKRWTEGKIVILSKPMVRKGISGVLIRVSDNGDGVPESIRNEIFEQFFTTKAAGIGTGLGLSLCLQIVKEHNGFLEVSQDPELGGACFEMWIPVDYAEPGQRPPVVA